MSKEAECWSPCSKLAYEIIVIDDNSPDGTQDVVKKLQTAYGTDKIVRLCPLDCYVQHALACFWGTACTAIHTEPAVLLQLLRPRPGKLGLGEHASTNSDTNTNRKDAAFMISTVTASFSMCDGLNLRSIIQHV